MPALVAADAVTFAIQASLKLWGQARQAYVEQTRAREITLPLPGLPVKPDVYEINVYFEPGHAGHPHLATNARLADLHARAAAAPDQFPSSDPRGFRDYRETFQILRSRELGLADEHGMDADALGALFAISQWRRGDAPGPTALQRAAGTLVEIGIDWYATGPGRIRGRSARARVLRTVLSALDDQSFAEDGLDGVLEKLFVAAIESAEAHPAWFTDDPKARDLVAALAHGLAADVNDRLAALGPEGRLFAGDQFGTTAQMVLRSVLRHGSETVLAEPAKFLGVAGAGNEALVSRVGRVLLDAFLPADGQGFDLRAGLTAERLDGVVREALRAVADHPELVGADPSDAALTQVVREIAAGVAASSATLGPDLALDAVRIALERAGANLALLRPPQGAAQTLATVALSSVLAQISAPPPAGAAWNPTFGREDALAVMEAVIDEAADHPAWVTQAVGGRPALAAATNAVLAELRARDLGALDAAAVTAIVVASIRAASARLDFLEPLTVGGVTKPALSHVLEAVLGAAAGGAAGDAHTRWTLLRGSVLAAVVEVVLERMEESGVTDATLVLLRAVLADAVARIEARGRFSVADLDQDLRARLAA